MRPVTRGPQPPAYAPPAALGFSAANQNLLASVGVPDTQLATLLAYADHFAELLASPTGLTAPQKSALTLILGRMGDIYREAGAPLWEAIGAFCSFCESPLPGQFDVEHCMAKTPYPAYVTTWDNFLVACTSCNSVKSNNPARSVVYPLLPAPPHTINQYYTVVRVVNYEWPDLCPSAYRDMPPIFTWYWAGASHTLVLANDIGSHLNQFVGIDHAAHVVRANVLDSVAGGLLQNVPVEVTIGTTPHRTNNVLQMIDLCDLNRRGQTMTDRRSVNRTKAWFTALRAMYTLVGATSGPDFDSRLTLVADSAAATGFYSMWVWLFSLMPAPALLNHPPGTTLGDVFVQSAEVQQRFPGTNLAQVP